MLKRRIGAALRGLAARLPGAPRRNAAPPFRASYGPERLRGVSARIDARAPDSLKDGSAEPPPLDQSALLRYFDDHASPRFFTDVRKLLAKRDQRADPRLEGWLEAAGTEIEAATERGLNVYGRLTSPLQPGYRWNKDAAFAAEPDLLFPIRAHRFGFAPRYALAIVGGAASAESLSALLDDWMQFASAHPNLPFRSNLVATQRLFSSAWAFHFLAAHPGTPACHDCRYRLLLIMAQDIAYLLPRLGHSYPNNHLLLDRFAAWFIAVCYPEFMPSRPDVPAIEATWIAELMKQTYADGGSVEHSVHYQGLASEMAAAYLLLALVNQRRVDASVTARIASMLRFQAKLAGTDGSAPALGDSSDDPLFPLERDEGMSNAAAMREIYRALFDSAMPSVVEGHPSVERAFWLLGGSTAPEVKGVSSTALDEFEQTGLGLFSDQGDATRLTLRTAPSAATRVLTGHMHSDLMSITLTVAGEPLIVESGTFTYRFKRDPHSAANVNWRDYFAGPKAHNGIVVGDADPLGPLTGNFRPKAVLPEARHVGRTAAAGLAFLEAEMRPRTGFPNVVRGVIHIAGVGFVVYDVVDGERTDDVRLALQFAAECDVRVASNGELDVRRGSAALALCWSQGLEPVDVVTGREQPTNGWVSYEYGHRAAAPQALAKRARGAGLTSFGLLYDRAAGHSTLETYQPSAGQRAFRLKSADCDDFVLLSVGADQAVSAWGIRFCGRLAWIRIRQGERPVVRWVQGSSCTLESHGAIHPHGEPAAAPG